MTDTQAQTPTIDANAPAILHMASGIAVITRITKVDGEGFHLYKPCEMIVRMTGPGQFQIGYVPYLSLGGLLKAHDNLVIGEHHIIDVEPDVPERISKGYLEFITGFALPPGAAADSMKSLLARV